MLVGPWFTEEDTMSRRQYLALHNQRRPRKKKKRTAPPPRVVAAAPAAPRETTPPPPPVWTAPRVRASRLVVEHRKRVRKTAESDSSLSTSDSDPDYLGSSSSSSDDDAKRPEPRREELVPLASWYREVDDGVPRRGGKGGALEKYHDTTHYQDVMRSEMKAWVVKLQLPGVDADGLAQACLDLWIKVHSAPAWGRARWDDKAAAVYSVPYHVLCVLSEMRCPGGLKIRINKLHHYNTRHRYEDEPLASVVAVPHVAAVEMGMPLKKDLARRFNEIRAVDSRERLSSSSSPSGPNGGGAAPVRKTTFRWDNKRFSRCQTRLRTCLDDYHRIVFHFET
jgi:hypothetical protein